ncbi:hypothetical protein [Paenibacillus sp. DMB20]|uniref:hypothetical protein n=1 Tax=Paenibacillus sp. DMB20 TaxID=1642570 RepID=UPI000628153D|nr:hypothetical protein [Paenibacillus sp. DMB20]KKO51140.1 hypothetical protein XI25_29580 [Paenibacillus sp. DMB20]
MKLHKDGTPEEFTVEVSFAAASLMNGKGLSDEVESVMAEQIKEAGKNMSDYKIIRTEDYRDEKYIYTAVPK